MLFTPYGLFTLYEPSIPIGFHNLYEFIIWMKKKNIALDQLASLEAR